MKLVALSLMLAPLLLGNLMPPKTETFRVVTELAVGGKRECRGFEAVWTDLVPMAGFTPLEVLAPEQWLAKEGEVVSFLGREVLAPRVSVFEGEDSCEPAQRRSDFRDSPMGARLYREGLRARTPALAATDLRPFDGLRLRLDGEMLEAELGAGDLGPRIEALQIVVHYDGCGKKPLGFARATELFAVADGAPHRARFPALARDERGLARAHSVQVRGGDPVRFLLDRELSRAGVLVRCP